jgi:two-component system cell cycle sensor histidine kinase/response regulator CckA
MATKPIIPQSPVGGKAADAFAASPPVSELRLAGAATKEAGDFTGQGTILLVEDEQSLRPLIARGLRSRGYR